MPTQDDIERAKTRREQRKAAREAAVEKAHAQEAAISDNVAKAKEEAKNPTKPAPRPVRKTRKEQVREARAAAEKKAAEQEQRVVGSRVDTEPYKVRSYVNPPLHVLNQMSQDAEIPIRREAREIANAAGKAAFDVALGKTALHRGPRRIAKVAKAQAALSQKQQQDDQNEQNKG